jgi:predicted transglutaminase-like cysteine proteinase
MSKLSIGAIVVVAALMTGPAQAVQGGGEPAIFAPVGDVTSVPAGYQQFCRDQPADCARENGPARDVVLSKTAWRDLVTLNKRVNEAIEPVTDLDNYGRVEVWTYPTGGRGDCEDYVVLKRKLLIDAGWPASALLITVVRDRKGDGHAVLMVKTDRGEYVLDNQESRVLPWQLTGYRYVKRQSQYDQNVWVSLGDTQTTPVVASPA